MSFVGLDAGTMMNVQPQLGEMKYAARVVDSCVSATRRDTATTWYSLRWFFIHLSKGVMILSKSELISSLQKEIRILLHLATKIDGSMLDYRPTPKQRSD